ncbi:MAG: citrate lyase subunit beta / citryl-CoA lyase [Betaproteobacteria bacterium]|nr:citrate lyase subunit beta / citryl-CoA lyase [Betaproteobacteria bacterium]
MQELICRTYLFVPATRTDRVAKALAAAPDAVIVDLEDAVAPGEKRSAREAAARGFPNADSVFIRVNGPETEWFEEDLKLCSALDVLGVVVPKAETPEQMRHVGSRLKPESILLPLVETARGYENAGRICAVPRVQRLVFGSIDFQLDLGISGDREELLYFRSGIVLASKLAGVQPPVDGVTVDIENVERVRDDALYAKRLGFGGKLCIHPKQIAPVNECFNPSSDEITWAQRVVDAAGAAKGGAVQVDGKMVDRPVLIKAQEILLEAARRKT